MVISMKICKVEECGNKNHSHGYCNKHRIQFKRHGKITDEKIEPLLGEIWADIPEHDNYKISNYGRVLSKSRNKLLVINEMNTNKEYRLSVKLGEKSCIRIPTTIAKAFIPNTNNDTQIVFLDGDNHNVQLGNIQWKGLFRRHGFIEALKKDTTITGTALLDYINGNPSKLNVIIDNNYVSLKRSAFYQVSKSQGYSYNFDICMVDDAVQEGLVKGLSALQRGMLNDISNFIGWLATIIRNTAKNIMYIERRYYSENVTNSNGDEFSLITSGVI